MTARLYRYLCVCNEQLSTWVDMRDMKAGERCDRCGRVYDVAYNGVVKPMPLPDSATVTLNDGTIHHHRYSIAVDQDRSGLKDAITATLVQET